ncbi:MAG TPA: DUF2079 domain-containing protein [Alphaproteobacteria bacterium]|nr:DUF2079 domain-containing protein [Alphaproteobacteria bacterium]
MRTLLQQLNPKHAAFVCFTGLVLTAYLGLGGVLPLGRPIFFTASALLLPMACLFLWIALSYVLTRLTAEAPTPLLPQTAFPFTALLLFALFVPEFLFGTPSFLRLSLITFFALILFALFFLLILSRNVQPALSRVESASPYIFCSLVIFHAALTIVFVILRHVNFGAVIGEDTAYYNQIFWDTLHGGFFKGSLTQERYANPPVSTEFAIHNSPILFIIFPFYWLYPSYLTLLVLRNLVLSLSSIPIFLLSRSKFNGIVALLLSSTYLFSQHLLLQSVNAFYPIQFTPLFLASTFLFFFRNKFIYFIVFFILTLSVREEISLTMCLFGLYAFFQKRSWSWIIIPLLLSVVWWYVSTSLIMVGSQIAMEDLDNFFNMFGTSYNSILMSIFSQPLKFISLIFTNQSIAYLYGLIRPSAMLSFLGIEGLFIIPTTFMNLLVGAFWKSTLDISMHYSVVAFVCVFLSTIYGLERLTHRYGFFHITRNIFAISIVLLLIPQTMIGLKDVVCPVGCSKDTLISDLLPKEYQSSLEKIITILNQEYDASIAAPNIMLPQLSRHRKLYFTNRLWRYKDVMPDYVVLDTLPERMSDNDPYAERYRLVIAAIQGNDRYRLIFRQDGFELYQLASAPMVQGGGRP